MAEILLITADEETAAQTDAQFKLRRLRLVIERDMEQAMVFITLKQLPLIILDSGCAIEDPAQCIERIRQQSKSPVFLINGDASEEEVIRFLDAGADDVLSAACSATELAARAAAVLRRRKLYGIKDKDEGEYIEAREIFVDTAQRRVWVRGKEKHLTRREYELLVFFMRHIDRVFTRQELYSRVWGEEVVGDMATVTVHIKKLRNMIEEKPAYPTIIATDWGVGYVFQGKAPQW